MIGSNVTLACHVQTGADVDWIRYEHSDWKTIYSKNSIYGEFNGTFDVSKTADGRYELLIRNVRFDDAGKYACIESSGFGQQHTMGLDVIGKICNCYI